MHIEYCYCDQKCEQTLVSQIGGHLSSVHWEKPIFELVYEIVKRNTVHMGLDTTKPVFWVSDKATRPGSNSRPLDLQSDAHL